MVPDFLPKLVRQNNHIRKFIVGQGFLFDVSCEPQACILEELEIQAFPHRCCTGLVAPERNLGCCDPLEPFHCASICFSIQGQPEGVQQLGSRTEPDGLTFLSHCQCGNPDRNQTILSKRQTVFAISCNLQDKSAVC